MNSFQTFLRLIKFSVSYKWLFLLGQIGTLLVAVSDGVLIYQFKPIIEKGFMERDPIYIAFLPLGVVVFFMLRGIATVMSIYFMSCVGRGVVRDFRQAMVRKLTHLPVDFYDHHASGDLISKVNFDAHQVAEAISEAITSAIRGVFTTLSMLVVMLNINPHVTLLLVVTIPILGFYLNKISRKLRQQSMEIQKSMGDVTHVTGEIVNGNKVIKIFSGFNYEQVRFNEAANSNYLQEMRMTRISASSIAVMQFIGACALAAFLYLATLPENTILSTSMTAGDFVAMATAILGLLKPIKQIAAVNTTLQRGIAAAKSIFSLLDQKEETEHFSKSLKKAKGHLKLDKVYFKYQNSLNWVLKNINLEIKAGETVALVGKSGGGKTTLASLLPRFYELSTGTIYLDDSNIADLSLENLRENIGLVSQHIILFNDSIYNNIAYGVNQNASLDAVLEAAKLAHVLEFAEKLPEGMNTQIGEHGVLLSGGQRQRVAIARALLKDAPILILDEATSALDTESEFYIQQALDTLMKNKTTIVIAHRLSTIEKADKIILIDQGEIVEIGKHTELLSRNGAYAKLQQSQMFAEA
ncbi:MAG: lipid A export permease/ATP-binding protein MsbA [Gammaproteobacteria bacterium]